MRVHSTYLGQFVPGLMTLPENPIIGGMGNLSDLVPAHFTLPENPFWPGLTGLADFVDASFAVPQNPVSDAEGMGDFVNNDSMYPIYLNSVLQEHRDRGGIAGLSGDHDDCGCGCGGGGGCGGGMAGLGDFSSWASGQMSKIMAGDVATIALWGAGALALMYVVFGFRGTGYRGAAKDARAKYRAEVARLRAQYPTGYQRGRRAAEAF